MHEEAYRRLMQAHLALGDPEAALQVYATCQARLAEELQVQPSAETVELAEHVRTTMLQRHEHTVPIQSNDPPRALLSPLIGRAPVFSQLVDCFQDARQGHPQGVIIEGEAGIGKTRLVSEFVAWARAQRADALSGHVLESGVRLPYQPLVEAMRSRLEEENAPEDLLDDLWLVELSRVLPELRIRYPDLPAPSQDELTDQLRFFEAVARLFRLWPGADRSSCSLMMCNGLIALLATCYTTWLASGTNKKRPYCCSYGTQRSPGDGLTPVSQIRRREKNLPFMEVTLQPLSQQEVLHLTEAIIDDVGDDLGGVQQSLTRPGKSNASKEGASTPQNLLITLARFLFEQTGGQPLYLMETFKLLLDRRG